MVVQPGLCSTWSETPKTVFFLSRRGSFVVKFEMYSTFPEKHVNLLNNILQIYSPIMDVVMVLFCVIILKGLN